MTLPGGLGAWAVTQPAEIRSAARNRLLVHDVRRVTDSAHGFPTRRYPLDGVSAGRHVLSSDGADHKRLRALLQPFFSSDATERRTPTIRRTVTRALDRLAAQGGGDLVADLAVPVAVRSVIDLLGLPEEDARELAELSLRLSGPEHPRSPPMEAAAQAMRKRMARLLVHTRRHPGNNLTTALLRAHGDDLIRGGELLDSLVFLLFAGLDSTLAAIPAGAVHLLKRDESATVRALLRTTDAMDTMVVEDLIRLAAPFTYGVWRFAAEPLQLGQHLLRRGDVVVLCFSAGNVDPLAHFSPWEVHGRPLAPGDHLSFGHGRHYCPGAALGRAQVRLALTELLRRFPGIRLAVDRRDLVCRGNVARHFVSVPVLTGEPPKRR
ncbi:cytochrome P450 [Streptomyces enissocaesilis]|uniref:Cytochrome P450 n=1 Tax=Streptomyces enissocaesilis TaxID=332589 RepID=A0ABN3XLV9_9ACTN